MTNLNPTDRLQPGARQLLGAVEAGGTKFRAAVLNRELAIVEQMRVSTTTPDATLHAVADFFASQPDIGALGIASFGPLIVDRDSAAYGSIAPTPKPGWAGTPLLDHLRDATGVPAAIQTDVEAAAVAEYRIGAGRGYDSIAYVTVGTGIGAGVLIGGTPFRGRDHIELGHMPVRRVHSDDFAGVCPFHGDCLEGMASGPAMQARWGTTPSSLDGRDDVWNLEADYLAQLAGVLTYAFSPDKILFSGGVGARKHLAPRIATATSRHLGGYSVSHAANPNLIATAALGNDAGLIGAALLAESLLPSDPPTFSRYNR
ncbi:MAG: fructokinase [Paracrocinitomix sp.]|jgi:fructokinase